jgi:hypothetical protein
MYARYKHRCPGHHFQGRFKAKLIQDDLFLRAVTRYVHLNPVKTAAGRRLDPSRRLRLLNSCRWNSYFDCVFQVLSCFFRGGKRLRFFQ